jgi:hypothetical protein
MMTANDYLKNYVYDGVANEYAKLKGVPLREALDTLYRSRLYSEIRVVQPRPLAVGEIVRSAIGRDAETSGGLHRVDVRSEEDELPAVAGFLPLDHMFDFLVTEYTSPRWRLGRLRSDKIAHGIYI